MAGLFNLQIVTPEREVFNGQVEAVSLPGTDGSFGVMRNHAPLIAALDPGLLTATDDQARDIRMFIGGGFFQQLSGRQKNCPTASALLIIQNFGATLKDEHAKINRELYFQMLSKQALIIRVREDVMFRARLEVWLYFHVPLSIALLAALIAHIVSVFFYW